jgi:acetyl/propionyl-CoA carboxylase alpha subunit
MADAKKSTRAGTSPLVVKAVGRAGGRKMCDVVLADEDVEKLRAADASANPSFLKGMCVVFLVDPLKL